MSLFSSTEKSMDMNVDGYVIHCVPVLRFRVPVSVLVCHSRVP